MLSRDVLLMIYFALYLIKMPKAIYLSIFFFKMMFQVIFGGNLFYQIIKKNLNIFNWKAQKRSAVTISHVTHQRVINYQWLEVGSKYKA